MRESKIEKTVCSYAKEKGMLPFKFVSPGRVGVCDRMWICEGRVVFVEFKQRGKKPTVVQSRHHQELVRHGMTVYVVDDIDEGKEIVDYESEYGKPHRSAVRDPISGQ